MLVVKGRGGGGVRKETSYSTNSHEEKRRTHVCGQRRRKVSIATNNSAKLRAGSCRSKGLKTERWGETGGGGTGVTQGEGVGGGGGRAEREREREPNAYLLTSDVCSSY